jgi:conjugal transfer pilus assembly protein TraU
MPTKSVLLKILIYTIMLITQTEAVYGNSLSCHGSFVNPITDVCWSCLFPLTVGAMPVAGSRQPDTDNPSLPVCLCGSPVVHPGITVGFWEPMALVDVTRTPYCMVNLGGLQLPMGSPIEAGETESADSEHNNSFYYVHWYKYPLLYWLNIITDGLCLETGDMDIAYLTELDPTWNDDEWGFLQNPEAFLFGNLIAQAACSADAVAASFSKPLDSLFWCAGAQGSMYPLNGHVQEHVGGVQASTLLTERMAYKMHRDFLITDSIGENSPAICYNPRLSIIPKSRYRYQAVNPVPSIGENGCHPFGYTTTTWEAGHEIPFTGEDFGYLVWRKRNCCAA